MEEMNISKDELHQKIKEYEEYIACNNISQSTEIDANININTNTMDTISTKQRDSIVDDLLSEYRSQQQPQQQPIEANYFSTLTNVSYGAYMVDEMDENKDSENDQFGHESYGSDWIDTLQIANNKDLIYNNLRDLKKKRKQKHSITQNIDITRPSDYIHKYQDHDHYHRKSRTKRRKNKNKSRERSNSLPPNKNKKQSLAQQMADKKEENLTFKPKINKYSFNRTIDPNVQKRLNGWNVRRKRKLSQQRKQKMQDDDCKIKENVTFQPEVKTTIKKHKNKNYNDNDSDDDIDSTLPVQDRLYEREHRRIEKLAKTKQIIESQEMEQCPFKPKLHKTTLSSKIKEKFEDRKPIWERQNFVKKEKENKRLANKNKIIKETETNLTFQPKINKKSKEMVENAKLYTSYYPINVCERLLLQNPKNKKSKNNVNEKSNGKPHINATSQKILKESILFREVSDNFFKRQEIYELERKMKQVENKHINDNVLQNNKNNTNFQPNIGNANSVLSKSKRHKHRYHFEDKQQRYERLAFHDHEVIKRKTKLKAKELHRKHTFKPKINKKSAKMGRPSSIYELFQPEKSVKLKDKIQEEAEKIFRKQHPFEPKHSNDHNLIVAKQQQRIIKKSRCMLYQTYENEKKQKLLDARKRLDLQKMKECTFKPAINYNKNNKQKKILIAGLDRYKELKELSYKKQQETEKREHEVFNVSGKVLKSRKRNALGSLQTVTKPFNLQTTNKINKKSSKQETKSEKCKLFQPYTTLAKQRDLVWKILQQQCEDNTETNTICNDTKSIDSLLLTDDLQSIPDLDSGSPLV